MRLKEEAAHIVPTLLKYADHNAYREDTDTALALLNGELFASDSSPAGNDNLAPVRLVSIDPDAEETILASILYAHAALPMEILRDHVRHMDTPIRERVIDEYLRRRGKHDAPGRALERVSCTMEMVMDYGAYRDVQRHRMATQTMQPLSTTLGYETPPLITEFGYGERYDALMSQARETHALLAASECAPEAAYVLPLATRIRALFTWNLREVTHFVELRSARQGHPSYRRIAQDTYRVLAEAEPLLARYIRPNMNTYALTRD